MLRRLSCLVLAGAILLTGAIPVLSASASSSDETQVRFEKGKGKKGKKGKKGRKGKRHGKKGKKKQTETAVRAFI